MVARFSVVVAGQKVLDRAFDRFADTVQDWTPAWEKVGEFMYEHEERVFSSRGFGTWAQLATGEDATLVKTSAMKDSLTSKGGANIMEATSSTLLFGTTVKSDQGAPYPLFHQRGTSRMPERQVIGLRDVNRNQIMKIMQLHAVDAIKEFHKEAGRAASVTGK